MDPCVRSLCLDHKYCSVTPPLSTLHNLLTQCGCTAPGHQCVTTHHAIHSRCSVIGHNPHYCSVTCRKMTASPTFPCLTPIIKRETVLARRDPDGFYYVGVVIQEEEPGAFLIEFTKPCVDGERFPVILQKTRVCDIIQHEEALRRCIVPGDNVLAPWEPQLIRYGPGTVILGLETRDPLRATEDEELTISFWNGKKSTVPLRVAVWISPTVYHRIVDTLHCPVGSRRSTQDTAQSSTTYVITDRCAAVPIPVCSADHFHKHRWNYHSVHPHLPHCCFPTRSICTCCQDPKCQDWWSLSPRTTVYIQARKQPGDEELYSSTKMKPDSRWQSQRHFSSSSSEPEGEESLDDESDDETSLSRTTQSTMVDSAVNTDSSLWEKPRLDISDRPEWKYWKRSQPEPFYRKPGIIKSKNKLTPDLRAALSDTVGSSNQSSLFETISEPPSRRLTMKDVLVHTDFNPSKKERSLPAGERLGESEAIRLRDQQEKQERQRKKKMKHLEWERKREEESVQKSSDQQEAHRLKTLHRLQNEEQKLKDNQARNVTSMKAKMAAHEERSERHQTLATEDKKKEERRLGHLRSLRERIDQKEFQKCVANEQRERNHMEAQSRRLQDHYKEVAERVLQAEQQGGRSGRHREVVTETERGSQRQRGGHREL